MFLALDQLLNLAAKWRYMYGGQTGVPVVTRAIVGRGWGQGATHSQSLQSVFAHFPGLYVVMPASPACAAGLLVTALRADAPTIILENRALYDHKGAVTTPIPPIAFGRGRVVREGKDVTIVATSLMVHEATRAAELLAAEQVSAEIIDPRTIRPLDESIILTSLAKTGRLVVADGSWAFCGFSAEVAALAAEKAHAQLRAPVRRVTPPDCPAPVSQPLEEAFHPGPLAIAKACLAALAAERKLPNRVDDVQRTFQGPY
jgi:pyruvate dehydrogenase E1 component beta subunit